MSVSQLLRWDDHAKPAHPLTNRAKLSATYRNRCPGLPETRTLANRTPAQARRAYLQDGSVPPGALVAIGVLAIAVKVVVLAVLLAGAEVFLAKLRLFRVPELLAGSFLLALLAVTAANFLTAQA